MGLARLINRKYHLCIEDRYAAAVMHEWIYNYKPAPLGIRNTRGENAPKGCFVLTVQDIDGKQLDFIEKIARLTQAKIQVV